WRATSSSSLMGCRLEARGQRQLVVLAPGGDAAHDEQLLARVDEAELTCLADELRVGAGLRDASLKPHLLRAQRLHLGVTRLKLLLRVEVGVCRLPVEEGDKSQPADCEQPGWPQTVHTASVRAARLDPYARRTATMHAISGVTRTSQASTRSSSRSTSRVASPSTGRPGVRSSLIRIPPGARRSITRS